MIHFTSKSALRACEPYLPGGVRFQYVGSDSFTVHYFRNVDHVDGEPEIWRVRIPDLYEDEPSRVHMMQTPENAAKFGDRSWE